MKNTKKCLILNIFIAAFSLINLSAMEPTERPLTSSEGGPEYATGTPATSSESGSEYAEYANYVVSAEDKQRLRNKLKELRGVIDMFNEQIQTNEYDRKTMDEILHQKAIFLSAIELAVDMYSGDIPVDMNRIQEELNRLIQ